MSLPSWSISWFRQHQVDLFRMSLVNQDLYLTSVVIPDPNSRNHQTSPWRLAFRNYQQWKPYLLVLAPPLTCTAWVCKAMVADALRRLHRWYRYSPRSTPDETTLCLSKPWNVPAPAPDISTAKFWSPCRRSRAQTSVAKRHSLQRGSALAASWELQRSRGGRFWLFHPLSLLWSRYSPVLSYHPNKFFTRNPA